jgi:hypothetical protein
MTTAATPEDQPIRKVDVIVVYKVDRLTRSLADFAKLVELFDTHDVSFVSVTAHACRRKPLVGGMEGNRIRPSQFLPDERCSTRYAARRYFCRA